MALAFHATPAHAFTSADADTIFAAHLNAFYEEKDGQAWFRESTGGGKVSYWMRAEQLEMVLDVFERTTKNACVNGPGAIAAFLLHKATGDAGYLTKSREVFSWLRKTLFDPESGRVADNIQWDGRVRKMALTYNQGTFVGAAHLLGYQDDARLAATFTMNGLCHEGFLPPGNEKGDGGGFNGIGVRWIGRFVKDCQEEAAFGPWLQKNAEAAWQSRRSTDNLCWNRWPQPTPDGTRFSWGCSSAVVALQVASPTEPPKK